MVVVVGLALVFGFVACGGPPTSSNNATSAHEFVLRGDGLGAARFGQGEATAVAHLRTLLGAPVSSRPVDLSGNCTIDSGMEWPTVIAYFLHGVFVGYATGSLLGGPHAKIPHATTAAGLRIGDPLPRAAHLYGGFLQTSLAQGGSWSVPTPTGKLAGYLTSEANSTQPVPRIADVTAGSVGCPAASP
jgi:hypothetical protein